MDPTPAQPHASPSDRPAIRVVVDDLARVAADAVVRVADGSLAPLTPAAARLDREGGPRFAEQRRVASPLEAGAAVVTGGGDLPAPFVLHVVLRGAEASGREGPDPVRRALVSAWQRADDWALRAVAAPPVGAGQLGLEAAAAMLAETFGARRAPGAELRIVVDRDSERETVEAAVRGAAARGAAAR